MEYRVEGLAASAGVRVDTLRFYQARGLLHAPRRVGRVAIYDDDHLVCLRRIRSLQQKGLTLAQIGRVLKERPGDDALLEILVRQSVGERTLTRSELAAEAGVPEPLVRAVEAVGLVEPLTLNGEERFSEADLEMARAALRILEVGFPLPALLEHAVNHASHVQELCDAAIELFDGHVRRAGPASGEAEAITRVFQELLPQVTRLVALHFQRTLINRALNRLKSREETDALEAARAAMETARLEVEVAWR